MRGCSCTPCTVLCLCHQIKPHPLVILLFLSDPTLTLHNVTTAIATVEKWDRLCGVLGVPSSKGDQIRQSSSTLHDEKQAAVFWWLKSVPGPSWARLAHCLYRREESAALQQTLKYLKRPTGTGFIVSLCKVSQGALQYVLCLLTGCSIPLSVLSWSPDPRM